MTLCIGIVTTEGIVIAGDSRQTQTLSGITRIGSDNANKVFELTDHVIAATSGWAFLQPAGATIGNNISSLIEDFKPTIPVGSTVQEVATRLRDHFNTLYEEHIVHYPANALPAGQVALSFIVAGYDPGSRSGSLFGIDVPSARALVVGRTTANPGAWFIGHTEVVWRIIWGYDPRALQLAFVQATQPADTAQAQLQTLNYAIGWFTMVLQDAIDFAVGMIQITTTIQRFTPGMWTQLAAANVGGPIDVVVVEPGAAAKWVRRKQLHA